MSKAKNMDMQDNAAAYTGMGNALLDSGEYNKAVVAYDKAIELRQYAPAYCNRGDALRALNRDDDALQDYNTAIEKDPNYAPAYTGRGNALRALNRTDDALQDYYRLRDAIQPLKHKIDVKKISVDTRKVVTEDASFTKKLDDYMFFKLNIRSVEVDNVQVLEFNRMLIKDLGNHILPISNVRDAIKLYMKNLVLNNSKNELNKQIKNVYLEQLLVKFTSRKYMMSDKVKQYYDYLLNNELKKKSRWDAADEYTIQKVVSFVLYVWDHRLATVFYDKKARDALLAEGRTIQAINNKIKQQITEIAQDNTDKTRDMILSLLFNGLDVPPVLTSYQATEICAYKYIHNTIFYLVEELIKKKDSAKEA